MKSWFHANLWWSLFVATGEILIFYFAGSLFQKLVMRLARRAKNKGIWTFFASFTNIFCKLVGFIIALDQLGVSMNLIIGAMSALGVGISLALKDNMASVAGGLQLLLTKPFKVGDYIKMGKHEGTVRSIEMTYTTLDTRNNETVIIPNNLLILKTVTNLSSLPDRRVVITYPSDMCDISRNERELLIAAKSSELVLDSPEPKVTITSYQMHAATLELLAYTKPENYWKCSAQIMDNIHRLQSQGLIDSNAKASEVSDNSDDSGSDNESGSDDNHNSGPDNDSGTSSDSGINGNSGPVSVTEASDHFSQGNVSDPNTVSSQAAPSCTSGNSASDNAIAASGSLPDSSGCQQMNQNVNSGNAAAGSNPPGNGSAENAPSPNQSDAGSTASA